MRYILLILVLILASCQTDIGGDPSGVGTQQGALTGGCRTICPHCPKNQICPMIACYLDCPQQCLQTLLCIQGYLFSPQKCACVPERVAAKCQTDADCTLVADYCGGCFCDALGPKDKAPSCISTVKCAADPCMNHTAACLSGKCSVQ